MNRSRKTRREKRNAAMAAAGASKAARSAADKQAATEKRTSTRESSSAATNLCEEATSSSQPTPQGRVTSPAPSMQSSTGKPPEPISTEDAKTATPTSAKLLGNDYNILVTDEEYPSKIQDKEFNYDEQSRELSLKVIKDKASAHESSSKKKHLISQIAEPHSEKTSNIHNFSSGDGVALNSLVQQMKLMRAELYDIRQHIARLVGVNLINTYSSIIVRFELFSFCQTLSTNFVIALFLL